MNAERVSSHQVSDCGNWISVLFLLQVSTVKLTQECIPGNKVLVSLLVVSLKSRGNYPKNYI